MAFLLPIVAFGALAAGSVIEHAGNAALRRAHLAPKNPPRKNPLTPALEQKIADAHTVSPAAPIEAPVVPAENTSIKVQGNDKGPSTAQRAAVLAGSTGVTLPPVGIRGPGALGRVSLLGR